MPSTTKSLRIPRPAERARSGPAARIPARLTTASNRFRSFSASATSGWVATGYRKQGLTPRGLVLPGQPQKPRPPVPPPRSLSSPGPTSVTRSTAVAWFCAAKDQGTKPRSPSAFRAMAQRNWWRNMLGWRKPKLFRPGDFSRFVHMFAFAVQ